MKLKLPFSSPSRLRGHRAFTLLELLVGMGLMAGILVGAIAAVQLFGMRIYILSATKLTATADARHALNTLRNDIRSAKTLYVGNYTNNSFSRIDDGEPQTGNALEVYFTATNGEPSGTPVIYYQQSTPASDALYSVSNNVVTELANYITNYYMFTAEDFQAQTLNTPDNNRVIRVTFQFYKWEYPIGVIGTNGVNTYNFYRLQTRVTRRAKE